MQLVASGSSRSGQSQAAQGPWHGRLDLGGGRALEDQALCGHARPSQPVSEFQTVGLSMVFKEDAPIVTHPAATTR